MDEYTANPYQTEVEANRVLKKMQADKNVEAAKAAEGKAGVETARAKLREMGYLKGSGGGGSSSGDFMPKTGLNKKPTFKTGGAVKSASSRADGCVVKGKTKGRMV